MGDVLTKEEDRKVRSLRERLRVQGGTMTADSFLVTKDESLLLSMVDRLVSEVERLRARNEALERVAKAADLLHAMLKTHFDQRGFCVAGHVKIHPPHEPTCRDYDKALADALSALAEPGKGGAT